jgi:hypothetical protein
MDGLRSLVRSGLMRPEPCCPGERPEPGFRRDDRAFRRGSPALTSGAVAASRFRECASWTLSFNAPVHCVCVI